MKNISQFTQRFAALVVSVIGLLAVLRWGSQWEAIELVLPGSKNIGLNGPLMLLASGLALLLTSAAPVPRPVQRVRSALIVATAGLSLLILGEHLFGISLGIDFVRVATPPSPDLPHPGRAAPNTCLAFLLASAALYLANRPQRGRALDRVLIAATCALMALAFAALAGHFLKLSQLYQVASFNTMLAPTAFALSVLAIGLWFALANVIDDRELSVAAYARKINSRVAAILFLVAASTGVAGFSIMRDGLEQAVLQNILLSATTNAASLSNTLEGRLWLSSTIATRVSVAASLAELQRNPADRAARAVLTAIGDSYLPAGIGHVRFESVDGLLRAESGKAQGGNPVARMPVRHAGRRAELLWQGGYLLLAESEVLADGKVVGRIRTEERLPAFEKLMSQIQRSGGSSDVIVCGRVLDEAVCAPSRFYPRSEHFPMYRADGQLNLPINRALMNETGTVRARDLRHIQVLAAYTPLAGFGLGMVIKIDESTVYAPLRERAAELAALALVLVGVGALAVRVQVLPLLARLVREQLRNKVILANSNDAFIALGVDGRVTDWNAQAEKIFGWSEAEAAGHALTELIVPPEHRRAHADGLKRFAATGTGAAINRQIEVSASRRDGSLFPVELSVSGYHSDEGFVSTAFVRDITARKAAETQLAGSEKFLRTVTDNIPAMIAYIDAAQRLRFANAGWRQVGLDPDDMVGKSLREVMGAPLYRHNEAAILRGLAGERVHFERTSVPAPWPTHLMVDFIPDRAADDGVAGLYIMATDISERKAAELRQAESERRAEAASRAKSEFVANMSHEIRTPMNAVLGIAHLLGTTGLAPDQRKYLDMIRLSGTSLMNILNDVLDVSKIEAGRLELEPAPFELGELLNAVATIMTVNTGQKDLELAIGVDPGVPQRLDGDMQRLQQVLVNVVGNAIKFTERGEVSLLVEQVSREGDHAMLRFLVRDSGIGISAEQQVELFTAFSQADTSITRRFGGTGLGLAISRSLVALMSGRIEVHSQIGVGSEFSITVPLRVIEGQAVREAGAREPWRLLVVDDNATSREYLSKTVRSWHWQADSVASGAEALEQIRVQRSGGRGYHAILADWQMPGMDGLATLQALREQVPPDEMPVVIMVSAFDRPRLTQAPGVDGAAAILLKPVTASSLFDTLNEALVKRGPSAVPAAPVNSPALALDQRIQGVRILLVEDNPLNRVVARGMLEHAGAVVSAVDDGSKAVELLRAVPAAYDLVLMDVQMPVMDGYAATRAIRHELGLAIPVLAMTAGVMPSERAQCIESGMNDFIAKPVDVYALLDTVARHCPGLRAHDAPLQLQPAAVEKAGGVFNIDTLLAMSKDNGKQRKNLLAVMTRAVAAAPLEMEQARLAWQGGAHEEAARLVHGLRGAIGTFGARRFAAAALELEMALRAGQAERLDELFASVGAEMDATLAAAAGSLYELAMDERRKR